MNKGGGEKRVFSACVFFFLEPDAGRVLLEALVVEDVDSRTIAIRIKVGSIRGQRGALWVETALPLLRKNIKKPLDQQLMPRGASETGILLGSGSFVFTAMRAAAGC